MGARSRRDRVLDEASRRLNMLGVSSTSLNDVADTLGVSRPALYYYVKDRADLVFQCYRRSCATIARRIADATEGQSSPLAALATFVRYAHGDPDYDPSYISEIGYLPAAARDEIRQAIRANTARLGGVIERGIAQGEIRPCNPLVVGFVVMNLASFVPFARRWSMASPDISRSRMVDAVETLLRRGWASDPARLPAGGSIDLAPLFPSAALAFDRAAAGRAKQEAILAAASRLFNQQGVETTSLDQIAAAVGATKRALYYHVGDKSTLLAQCYRRTFRIHDFAVERAAAFRVGVDAAGAYNRAIVSAQARPEISPLRPLDGLELMTAADQDAIRALAAGTARRLGELFALADRDGSVRPLDWPAVLLMLPGATSWLAKGLIEPSDRLDETKIAGEIDDFLRIGLSASLVRA